MTRPTKASSAGSIQRRAGRFGRIVCGAFATRGTSSDVHGSGAPSPAPSSHAAASPSEQASRSDSFAQQASGAALCFHPPGRASEPAGRDGERGPQSLSVGRRWHSPPCRPTQPRRSPPPRPALAAACVSLLAILALALTAAPALALSAHVFSTSFGSSGSGSGQFSGPSAVAVDQTSHDVYVTDPGNFRVEKFDSAGNFILMFGKGVDQTTGGDVCTAVSLHICQAGTSGSSPGAFTTPNFIAVDNLAGVGDVYVADTGDNLVSKFDGSGALITSWGDSSLNAPAPNGQLDGSAASGGPFGLLAGIAVDSAGTLDVFEVAPRILFEFAQNGTFSTDFHTPRGTAPRGLAVDSAGNFFKVVNGSLSVEKFDGSGNDIGQVDSAGNTTGLGVDSSSGDLYVDNGGGAIDHYAFDGSGNVIGSGCTPAPFSGCPATDSFGSGHLTGASGLAVDSSNGNVYAADTGDQRVAVFNAVTLPDVTTGQASNLAPTSATLNGTVNPSNAGAITDCHFAYVDDADYQPSATDPYGAGATIPCDTTPSGSNPVPVSADVSGLSPLTNYHFRLEAANANGPVHGNDQAFETTAAPAVDSESVQNVTSTEALLRAQVNPGNADTTYHFEYGTAVAYGTNAPVPDGDLGAGSSDQLASTPIGGLSPSTTYHFRVVAQNSFGTTDGPDQTFTTYPPPATGLPDGRAYEQVSPAQKSGNQAGVVFNAFEDVPQYSVAQSDGNGVFFEGTGPMGASASGEDRNFVARRSTSGWVTEVAAPRTLGTPFIVTDSLTTALPSADLSRLLFTNHAYMVPDDPPGPNPPGALVPIGNIYLANGASGPLTWVGQPTMTTPVPALQHLSSVVAGSTAPAGASPDLSTVYFTYPGTLVPDDGSRAQEVAPDGTSSAFGFYEWHDGVLSAAGVLPDGSLNPFGAVPAAAGGEEAALASPEVVANQVSTDGSRAFFVSPDPNCTGAAVPCTGSQAVPQLYVRENGQTTVLLSRSAITDQPAPDGVVRTNVPVSISSGGAGSTYVYASPDGSRAFFASTDSLTVDAPHDGSTKEYEYELDTNSLQYLPQVPVANIEPILTSSRDGSTFLFEDLATMQLELSHDGQVTTIAGWSGPSDASSKFTPARATADGSVFVFETTANLSPGTFNNSSGYEEVYRYDVATNALTCVSCASAGVSATGDANLSNDAGTPQGTYLPTRGLSRGGDQIFFDTPDPLVTQDSNGKRDVYEWEASGTGSCHTAGGCVYLISSGRGSLDSFFLDNSASGDDVFFATAAGLVSGDTDGAYDVYDARVGGGLPAPPNTPPCSDDACKPPPSQSPSDQTPGSGNFSGPGNPAPVHRKCKKGFVPKHGKCVKKHHQHHKKHRGAATTTRRTSR